LFVCHDLKKASSLTLVRQIHILKHTTQHHTNKPHNTAFTMGGSDKVLVYSYRAGKKDEPKVMTKDEVDDEVQKSKSLFAISSICTNRNQGAGSLQVTTKTLDSSQSIVTIKERDLRNPEQQKVSRDSFAK
jgi:hypothetical protein